MRKMLLTIATASLATLGLGTVAQANELSVQDAEKSETVRVHSVDMKGKPPFKRSTEVLSVSDAAALEVADEKASKGPKGRPPYARQR
ncbi:hypothetical protein [Parahaliea aestuarii]|uniref:Uncharacterized protein n=1 Tax=Parahaliea aestuarii TaxID=1852021 RepID=A0A5C8ZS01_9GAMM|nr:hypothetical protein [Parahaliea aestuarii]TXS90440.1 hypothetical protein FVW59_13940 [Parahaliea aestuarii]